MTVLPSSSLTEAQRYGIVGEIPTAGGGEGGPGIQGTEAFTEYLHGQRIEEIALEALGRVEEASTGVRDRVSVYVECLVYAGNTEDVREKAQGILDGGTDRV